ncbi:myelin protein zero-like protein 2 isoform X2 [Stigmatopora argus]
MFVSLVWPIWLLLLGGIVLSGVARVSGIEIYAPPLVEAVNGTAVKLKCTFRSTRPVSSDSVIVSWNFRPLNSKTEESVFHYQEVAYPPVSGRFKGHAVWSGDIGRNDGSITLHEVSPTFNGTYICNVRNRLDSQGNNPETVLKVVTQASLTEISILVIAIVATSVFILIILGIFLAVKIRKLRLRAEGQGEDQGEDQGENVELSPQKPKRKDPTECKPEEALHLTVVKEKLEVDSSDDEESEPSSGGDDDEDGSEEEDDDDDDDDDYDNDDDD